MNHFKNYYIKDFMHKPNEYKYIGQPIYNENTNIKELFEQENKPENNIEETVQMDKEQNNTFYKLYNNKKIILLVIMVILIILYMNQQMI